MHSTWYLADHLFWSFESNTDYPPNQYICVLYLAQTMAVAKGNPVFWMLSKNFCFLILISVKKLFIIFLSSVQSLSRVRLFATQWTPARQASLSITNSWSPPKLISIESVMPSKNVILFCPLSSCPQSVPTSESFPMSQLFASGGQSIGISASMSFQWTPRTDLL